ncbi:MAG: DUF4124 domain-containing protein [Lysobacteraceae bacterium]|nr:MAG: DUF4124 domain-containing protein [Xanthomonadaceae bacterium]
MRRAPLILSLLVLPTCAVVAQEVTIYRCVDAKGNLALRDSPCAKGEKQEVRSMQRPKDPVIRETAVAAPTPAPARGPARDVQVIYRNPPRPLYECVTPDGQRYTSENGEGNPRSVPLWTLGYSGWANRGHGGGTLSAEDRPGRPRPPHGPGGYGPGYGGVAYTLVRDECHPLPQQEVCSRLSDRRYEIIRRYNVAPPGELRQLDLEQRGIDARLAQDCGN